MDPHINPATGVWDDNYYANIGKFGGTAGGAPAFNFDFEAEAKKAYGESGAYYNELLAQSQGDVNKALARLVEDYDTGIRYKKQDTATAKDEVGIAQNEADRQREESRKNVINAALARGLYQKSPGDPAGGYGIPDTEQAQVTAAADFGDAARTRQLTAIDQGLTRYTEQAGTTLGRQQVDLPEKQKRYEGDLEQQRRAEAAQLANLRGDQALQKYNSQLF